MVILGLNKSLNELLIYPTTRIRKFLPLFTFLSNFFLKIVNMPILTVNIHSLEVFSKNK